MMHGMTLSAALTPSVAAPLNGALAHALAGINQYFLHARILKHMGYMVLADNEYKESIAEMKHADRLVERILAVGGMPNMQEQAGIFVGQDVRSILEGDLKYAENSRSQLLPAIALSKQAGDAPSAAMLEKLLASTEERIAAARGHLNRIDTIGLESYLLTQS